MFRRKKIFTNYHLYGIPYIYISSIKQLDQIHDGFVGLDELWLICDARLSLNKKNRFVAGILSKSRKRILNYTFTAQLLDQLDKRIRKVLDFCLPPDEKIVCNPSIKNINDISIGDKVLSHTGKFEVVDNVMSRYYNGKIVEIVPNHLRIPTRLTENHPIFVATPIWNTKYLVNKFWKKYEVDMIIDDFFVESVKKTSEKLSKDRSLVENKRKELKRKLDFIFEWKQAGELKKGDLIAFPIIKETGNFEEMKISDYCKSSHRWMLSNDSWRYGKQKLNNIIKVDGKFLKFVGYYLGDGGIYLSNVSIAFNPKEKEKIGEVTSLFREVFGLEAKAIPKNKNSEMLVHCNSYPLAVFLESLFGKGSENKRLPQEFLTLPVEKQKSVLDGYLASDGHKFKNCNSYSFATVSELLAFQISQIVLRSGMKITLKKENPSKIGKKMVFSGYISKRMFNSFIYNGFFITPIKSIEKKDYLGKVYNFSVRNGESYTTPSLCVHNCAYPIMNTAETLTRVNIFRTGYPREGSYMKTFYFKNAGIFPLYDTNEEIMMDGDDANEGDPPICFQESKDSPLEEFETWEEADARAEKFWMKNQWMLKEIF